MNAIIEPVAKTTDCETFPANDIAIGVSGESTVDANVNQELEEQNGCEGLNSICENNGGNAFQIDATGTSEVKSVSDQTINAENDCKAGAQCTTELENSFSVAAQYGQQNKTQLEIPIYENPSEINIPTDTRMLEYNASDEFVEFPWKNTTAIVDIIEYQTCVEDSMQRSAEISKMMGTDTTTEGNRPQDVIRFSMDSCVMSNSENTDRMFKALEKAASK